MSVSAWSSSIVLSGDPSASSCNWAFSCCARARCPPLLAAACSSSCLALSFIASRAASCRLALLGGMFSGGGGGGGIFGIVEERLLGHSDSS